MIMDWQTIHAFIIVIQRCVSSIGIIIIVFGVIAALCQYLFFAITGVLITQGQKINTIRLNLGRTLILGLEFIVAADLIGTTTTPDYYAVGLLAIIVVVRTILSFSLNRELMSLSNNTE